MIKMKKQYELSEGQEERLRKILPRLGFFLIFNGIDVTNKDFSEKMSKERGSEYQVHDSVARFDIDEEGIEVLVLEDPYFMSRPAKPHLTEYYKRLMDAYNNTQDI